MLSLPPASRSANAARNSPASRPAGSRIKSAAAASGNPGISTLSVTIS